MSWLRFWAGTDDSARGQSTSTGAYGVPYFSMGILMLCSLANLMASG